MRFLYFVAFVIAVLTAAQDATAQSPPFLPARDGELALDGTFAWLDHPKYKSYHLLVRRFDNKAVVHSVFIDGADPGVCPNDGYCRLSPGAPAYPALTSIRYEWAILGQVAATGASEWWQPSNFTPFYAMPLLPAKVEAEWTGDTLEFDWPASFGAAQYRAEILNVFLPPFSALYSCPASACSGTRNVGNIKFGTFTVSVHACGLHGRCTRSGTNAEATRPPPGPIPAPNVFLPADGSTVKGMTLLAWQDQTNVERWRIAIGKDTGAPEMTVVVEETPWRTAVSCGKPLCTRQFALPPGFYAASVAAYSGGVWGPPRSVAFEVDSNGVTPAIASPGGAQATSIYPLFAWKGIAGVTSYVVSVDNGANVITRTVPCSAALCSFDTFDDQKPLPPGDYTWSVRIDVDGMPWAARTAFTTSFSYAPAAPEIVQPLERESLGLTSQVSTVFLADVQVPFFMATIRGPGGYYDHASPQIRRSSADCRLQWVGAQIRQNCSYTNPADAPLSCAGSGFHNVVVKTFTYTNLTGGNKSFSESPAREFSRLCEPPGGDAKDIYTIFAQNTQFLPLDLSTVYGMSQKERILELVKYIRRNDFDVVALSEVFSPEARDFLSLHMRQGYPYQFGIIDTAGDVAFTLREGSPYEATSGLAVYSRFPAFKETKSWNSNYQCTDDLFNQISESHPLYENVLLSLNDHLWFNQYCEAEGMDAQSAKGLAAIRLENPKTGVPLLVAWSHTQAATDEGLLTMVGDAVGVPLPDDYSYKDSYEKRESQVKEAGDSIAYLVGRMPAAFDAFVLGDWNIPQPMSMSRPPTWSSASGDRPGKPDLALAADPANAFAMYDKGCAVLGCDDPKDPSFASLVGDEFDPTPDGRIPQNLYSQYWLSFDPRNDERYIKQFYDLWLEQPLGDFGFTYDRRNPAALCSEEGEPCHARDPRGFDHGQRYDVVLARLHASNIENMKRTGASYPAGASPRWRGNVACVQHVRLARDFGRSDHYGTIIEVGPRADFCSPMTAKAAAQDRMSGQPAGYVPPADKAFNKYLGVHDGHFRHGGAGEWLYISEKGGYDFVNEGTMPIWIEAYDPSDLSTPLDTADSTQKKTGGLFGDPACNRESSGVSIEHFGYIPKECATSETRVTYRSPGPFYVRVYPVTPDGSRCYTCTGTYRLRIRSRSCKIVWDAVPTKSGLTMSDWDRNPEGWFGPGQSSCWFSAELRQPTKDDDFQTFTLGDLAAANGNRCAAASGPGTCSTAYTARLYHKGVTQTDPLDIPGGTIVPPITHDATTDGTRLLTDASWAVEEAAGNDHHLEQYLWLVQRSDKSKGHVALLPWHSDLKSVLFRSIRALEIDDDDKFICIPVPFFGCVPIRDPFQKEDEARIVIATNGAFDGVIAHDFEKGSALGLPNAWPGSLPGEVSAVYAGVPGAETRGTTLNFTQSAWIHAEDADDDSANDWLIADHLMVGIPVPGGGLDKQTSEIIYKDIGGGRPQLPFLWEFTDSGFLGAKVHYELEGRILRDP
ncbi:MAG: endonuclease/exonuclease/phosphatase family protein [Parvibaculaceae bacterium]